MPEEDKTYEANTFYMQEAALRPASRRGAARDAAGQGKAGPQSEEAEKGQLFTRDVIVRLIQTLKSK